MHARAILVGDTIPTGNTHGCHLIIKRDGCLGQIVKKRFQIVLKKAQPMLDTGMFAPSRNGFVQRIVSASGPKLQTVILAEPRNSGLIKDHLGDWREFDLGECFGRPLGGRIEAACAIKHIAKQIKPHRPRLPRWVDINDPAANGIITGLHHSRTLRKTHAHEEMAQCLFIHAVPDRRLESCFAQQCARGNTLGDGRERCEQDKLLWHPMNKPSQCSHPRSRDIGVW